MAVVPVDNSVVIALVGLVNFGRAALEHLIPKTGAQPVSEETNKNLWVLHESAPHPTLLKSLDIMPDG